MANKSSKFGEGNSIYLCSLLSQQTRKVPIIGVLLRDRVTPAFPFEVCGVDYAGPFAIKLNKGRGTKTMKGYIAFLSVLQRKRYI